MGRLSRWYLEERAKASATPSPSPRPDNDGGSPHKPILAQSYGSGEYLGDFFSNLGGDLVDIGKGLGILGINAVKDTAGETLEFSSDIAPGPGYYEHSSTMDDLAKAMVDDPERAGWNPLGGSIAQDYKRRYFSGSREFSKSAKEDPLALLTDLLSVVTAGGATAARGAGIASKGSKAADDLARLAMAEGTGTAAPQVGRTARVVDTILPGAKDRALIEAMGHSSQAPLGGVRNVLGPTGQRVEEVAREMNPTWRAFREGVWDRAMTRPVKALEKERDDKIRAALGQDATLEDLVKRADADDVTPTTLEIDALLLDRSVKLARSQGIDRAIRPTVASGIFGRHGQIGRLVNRITGDSKTRHVAHRDQDMSEWVEVFKQVPDKDLPNLHSKLQVEVPDAISPRLDYGAVVARLSAPDLADNPFGQKLSQVVAPHIQRIRGMEEDLAALGEEGLVRGNSHELAIRRLAELDADRASQRNGVGFNKDDSEVGHELATIPQSNWTEDQARVASGLVKRYRRQLESEGFQVSNMGDVLSPAERLSREIDAGKRIIEAVAGEPLAASGGEWMDVIAKTMDDVRLLNFEKQASRFIEQGGSYESLFRRQYLPLRVAEKRMRGLKSFEEATDPFDLDEAFKVAGKKTPVYYPHYEELVPDKASLLMSTNLHGARRRAQVSRYKKSSGVAFENHLKGIRDAYKKDPVEAYSLLAAEITKHDEMDRWIRDIADAVGRPVKATDEVGSGEVVMNLDGVSQMIRNRKTAMEMVHENLEGGLQMDDAFADAIKELFKTPAPHVAEALANRGALVAIPKAAGKKITAQASTAFNNAPLRLLWDAPMNAWRAWTLYAHPAYYINNAFGNTTFLKLQGGKLTGVVRQLSPKYRKAIREAIPGEALPDVETGFYGKTLQRSHHLGAAQETTAGQLLAGAKATKAGRAGTKGAEAGRRLNQAIENAFRRESFITATEKQAAKRGIKLSGNSFIRSERRLNQIAELGANPKIAQRALDEMDETMNNYMRLSAFERNIVRRFIAPFWPFYRHAARTLITMPYKHPAKTRLLMWIEQVTQENDELGPRPDFLENFLPQGPGGTPGTTAFLSTRGANPVSGITESPLALLGPVPKNVLEQLTGRDAFTGRQFSAPDVYNDPISGEQFRLNAETGTPEPLDRRFGGLLAPVTPSFDETLIRNVRPLDAIRDLTGEGARYTATGDVIRDETGAPLYPSNPVQQLLKLVGVSTLDYNLPQYQEKLAESQKRALSVLESRLNRP